MRPSRSRGRSITTLWLHSVSCTSCCVTRLAYALVNHLFSASVSSPKSPEMAHRGTEHASLWRPCCTAGMQAHHLSFQQTLPALPTLSANARALMPPGKGGPGAHAHRHKGCCPHPPDPSDTWQNIPDIWWADQHLLASCSHSSQKHPSLPPIFNNHTAPSTVRYLST